MKPGAVIAGLSMPSFVIVATALTLTIAVLAGEVESRRADLRAPAVAAPQPAHRESTGDDVGSVPAHRQAVARDDR